MNTWHDVAVYVAFCVVLVVLILAGGCSQPAIQESDLPIIIEWQEGGYACVPERRCEKG